MVEPLKPLGLMTAHEPEPLERSGQLKRSVHVVQFQPVERGSQVVMFLLQFIQRLSE